MQHSNLKRKSAQPPTSYWTFSVCAHLGHLSVYISVKPPLWSLTVRSKAVSINHPLQILSARQACMLDLAWAAPQMRKTGQALSLCTELLPAPQKQPVRLSRTWRNSRLQSFMYQLKLQDSIVGGELCGGEEWNRRYILASILQNSDAASQKTSYKHPKYSTIGIFK